MVHVLPLGPGDAALLRAVRLRALAQAPGAFTSSYEREAAFTTGTWGDRLRTCQWFVAVDKSEDGEDGGDLSGDGPGGGATGRIGDRPVVGVAGGLTGWPDGSDSRQLVAMWVDPASRRTGVAGALVEAVDRWARSTGARRLVLEVVVGNEPARAFYRRAGLVPTGVGDHALPGGRTVTVEVLERSW